jgi:hypothetical protein
LSDRTDRRTVYDEREIIDLERRGWDALCTPNGAAFYADLMTDDAVMVFPGAAMTKKESLAAMRAEKPWSSYKIDDPRVLRVGTGGRLVLYRATAKRTGAGTYVALMTSIYVRRSDGWKMVFHQQTPAPAR